MNSISGATPWRWRADEIGREDEGPLQHRDDEEVLRRLGRDLGRHAIDLARDGVFREQDFERAPANRNHRTITVAAWGEAAAPWRSASAGDRAKAASATRARPAGRATRARRVCAGAISAAASSAAPQRGAGAGASGCRLRRPFAR